MHFTQADLHVSLSNEPTVKLVHKPAS